MLWGMRLGLLTMISITFMRTLIKKLFPPKVEAFNFEHAFRVRGVSRWRLCGRVSKIPGLVFTRKLRWFGSSAEPYAEFRFRDLDFQIDDGGDLGGDGLWILPKDRQAHPVELRELREQLGSLLLQDQHVPKSERGS